MLNKYNFISIYMYNNKKQFVKLIYKIFKESANFLQVKITKSTLKLNFFQ